MELCACLHANEMFRKWDYSIKKLPLYANSYSLEGLAGERDDGKGWQAQGARSSQDQQSEDTGSQVSLTEEGQDSDLGDSSSLDSQVGES